MKRTAVVLWSLAITALAACGGGGGDDPPPAEQAPVPGANVAFPIEAAFVLALTTDATFTASSTEPNGTVVTFSQRLMPASDAPFQGVTRKRTMSIARIPAAGALQAQTTTFYYFSTAPLKLHGHEQSFFPSRSLGEWRAPYVADGELPATAVPGSAGPLVHYTVTTNIATVIGTGVVRRSLQPNTTTSAWLCLHIVETAANNAGVSSEDDCYLINTAGVASAAKYTVTANGQTRTFR